MKATFVVFFFLITGSWANSKETKDELSTIQRLRKALLQDAIPRYQNKARPVKKHTTTTNVSVTMLIERISDWDLRSGTLKMDGEIILTWKDEHLNWNPDQFDGLDNMFFSVGEVWTPEITLWSSSETDYISRLIDWSTPVAVNSTGHCEWWPSMALTTHCLAKLSAFPFDENECKIIIGPYAHTVSEIQMVNTDHLFEKGWTDEKTDGLYGPYIENSEYFVKKKSASTDIFNEAENYKWSWLVLKLTIQRRSILYAIYVGLPYTIASAIQIAMFIFTHPASFARAILSSVSLLLFFIAAILITVAIGNGALHSTDAPYAIKCTGVSIFIVSINLFISEFCYLWLPKKSNLPLMDKVSILWTNRYLHMILCRPCTYSIAMDDSTLNRVTVVSDRMRITEDDNLSNDEGSEEEKANSSQTSGQVAKQCESPLFVVIDRLQLLIYLILLVVYHS